MSTKDIKSHLADKYSDYLDTISMMSKSDDGKILVNDERKLYNFDKITEALYGNQHPESVDSMYASKRKIYFVEYKSGFKKKINKKNFKKENMTCPDDEGKYCEPYAKLFFENQKNENKILYHSIYMKAIESYVTFMKEIEANSDEDGIRKTLILCVVIDDYVESMEDTLTELAKKPSETNSMTSLRQSLSRLHKNSKKDYYYDEIRVLSPYEFKKSVTQNMLN